MKYLDDYSKLVEEVITFHGKHAAYFKDRQECFCRLLSIDVKFKVNDTFIEIETSLKKDDKEFDSLPDSIQIDINKLLIGTLHNKI
jgi:hypothetical protein